MALISSPMFAHHALQTNLEATYSNFSHHRMLVIEDISSPISRSSHAPILISTSSRPLTKSALLAPPNPWPTLCHYKADELRRTAEADVINAWRWPNEAVKNKVFSFQLGHATALCFPLALDDRIDVMCRLCLILVLVDGKAFFSPISPTSKLTRSLLQISSTTPPVRTQRHTKTA